eukprot:PLAT6519.1.p2 GENE.PLAT6519.1~~PLAT6519.1.p2  ORF type:complete len:172 (+),score=28.38 PLAT6519.1:95-610(+)
MCTTKKRLFMREEALGEVELVSQWRYLGVALLLTVVVALAAGVIVGQAGGSRLSWTYTLGAVVVPVSFWASYPTRIRVSPTYVGVRSAIGGWTIVPRSSVEISETAGAISFCNTEHWGDRKADSYISIVNDGEASWWFDDDFKNLIVSPRDGDVAAAVAELTASDMDQEAQ